MKKHIDLTQGHIGRQMIGMAVPMLAGTFSMTAFHLADTWFVVPFAVLGNVLFGLAGVFWGVVAGSNLAGLLALFYGRRRISESALRVAALQSARA